MVGGEESADVFILGYGGLAKFVAPRCRVLMALVTSCRTFGGLVTFASLPFRDVESSSTCNFSSRFWRPCDFSCGWKWFLASPSAALEMTGWVALWRKTGLLVAEEFSSGSCGFSMMGILPVEKAAVGQSLLLLGLSSG